MPPEPPKRQPPPLPRQPSRPDLQAAEVDRTVGGAENQRRFDLPKRAATLTGMPAPAAPGSKPPPAPKLPGELAPTLPAPNPLQRLTIRRPKPPSSVLLARRTPVPPPDDPPATSLPPVSQTPDAASNEALRRRAEAAEAGKAEAERQLRVQIEAKGPGPYQKPVERRQTPVPSSAPSKADAALGAGLRHLLGRFALPLLAAAGLGGGVTAVAKPSADPAKADATLANVEAMRADLTLIREQLTGVIKREAARDAYLRCVDEGMIDIGSQLLPAVDRQGAAQPLRAFVDRCQRLRP